MQGARWAEAATLCTLHSAHEAPVRSCPYVKRHAHACAHTATLHSEPRMSFIHRSEEPCIFHCCSHPAKRGKMDNDGVLRVEMRCHTPHMQGKTPLRTA